VYGASPSELLQLTGAVIDELTCRGICRTGNNPLSDYTEWLISEKYAWKRAPNSEQGYDAEDPISGARYEIKGRRITTKNPSRQLSAIRDLDARHFQFLIAVIYNRNFGIQRVMKIPHLVVAAKGRKSEHTNSWILAANDSLLKEQFVEDLTADFLEKH
jgi:hypothetical protein